jgi:hypothetical protein
MSETPTMTQAECACPNDCDCDGRFACEVQPTGCEGTWTCELVAGHEGWHRDGGHRWRHEEES